MYLRALNSAAALLPVLELQQLPCGGGRRSRDPNSCASLQSSQPGADRAISKVFVVCATNSLIAVSAQVIDGEKMPTAREQPRALQLAAHCCNDSPCMLLVHLLRAAARPCWRRRPVLRKFLPHHPVAAGAACMCLPGGAGSCGQLARLRAGSSACCRLAPTKAAAMGAPAATQTHEQQPAIGISTSTWALPCALRLAS